MSFAHRNYFNNIAESWNSKFGSDSLCEYLRQFGVAPGDKIMDIGAGTGCITQHLNALVEPGGQVVAADISEKMLWYARGRIQDPRIGFACADACALSFRSGYFDRIICYSTFPHIIRPQAALSEMYRVLKSHGKLLILHSCCSRELNRFHAGLNGIVCHDELPPVEKMLTLVKAAGFNVLHSIEKPDLYWLEVVKS